MDLRERTYNKCIKENIDDIRSKINTVINAYGIPSHIKRKIQLELNSVLKCTDNIFSMYLDLSFAKGERKEKLENQLYNILMKKLRTGIFTRYIQRVNEIYFASILYTLWFYYPKVTMRFILDMIDEFIEIGGGPEHTSPYQFLMEILPEPRVICSKSDIDVRTLIDLYDKGLKTENKLLWIDEVMYSAHQRGSFIPHLCGAIISMPDEELVLENLPIRIDYFDILIRCNEIIVKESNKILDCLRHYR